MIDKETKERILYALELGRDYVMEQATECHNTYIEGYSRYGYEQLDCHVRSIDIAIEMVNKL
jgi:hypothetical protein